MTRVGRISAVASPISETVDFSAIQALVHYIGFIESRLSEAAMRAEFATFWPRSAAALNAFTVIELFVLVGLVAVLSCLVTVGLSRTRPGGQSIQCQSNLARLAAAWQMYAEDHQDRIVPAGANTVLGQPTPPAWVAGWLDWTTSTDNTNVALLLSAKYALMGPYLNKSAEVFRCPMDHYLGQMQLAQGWTHRVRSYSLSGLPSSVFSPPTTGIYRQVSKTTQFQYPTPQETWMFLDEHPESINDGQFLNPNTSWIDLPATYHNGAAGFSFADGHAEIHQWKGSAMGLGMPLSPLQPPVVRPGDPDVRWMSYHTQRNSTNSY
jgi:prepilin-type processing-associated H-X9-DG protein